jgi:carboxypeptidase PM20D1
MIYIPFIFLLAAIIVTIVVRAVRHNPIEDIYEPLKDDTEVNAQDVALKLSEVIKLKTISHSNYSEFNFEEFEKFKDRLKVQFPLVHSVMELETVNGYSLVYKWNGSDKNMMPGLFMAHIDVVPIEEGTEGNWTHDAFSGAIVDGYVWGRGTMDIKLQIITMLEAGEKLIEKGFQPKRTIYFAFGHDEETDGSNGARMIVDMFIKRDIKFEFVMDEGGCINKGSFPGVKKPVAFMGVGEKGYLNVRVDIKGVGGHASTPPANSSLGLAAKAICRLEKKKMKLKLVVPVKNMIESLSRHMSLGGKILLANLWLFKPVFTGIFSKAGTTGEALLRTTIAPTMALGSMEPNVLPQVSSFTVNCRILQTDASSDVIKHIAGACKGMDFTTTILRHEEPSVISSCENEFFKLAAGAVRGLSEEIAIVPYLMVAGTDSIKFQEITNDTIRFTPFTIDASDMKRIHGTDERISIENIGDCVRYYCALFKVL